MFNKTLYDLPKHLLVEFISFLSLIPLGPGTSICTYLSGVRYHFKICLLPDFADSFFIALILKGVTSPECQDDVWLPISLHVLHQMFNALPLLMHAYNASMYQSLLTLGFFALFCPSELTYSQHVIMI